MAKPENDEKKVELGEAVKFEDPIRVAVKAKKEEKKPESKGKNKGNPPCSKVRGLPRCAQIGIKISRKPLTSDCGWAIIFLIANFAKSK